MMKKLNLLMLIIVTLFSSCSIIKKNGYYQSRSYKSGKHFFFIDRNRKKTITNQDKQYTFKEKTIALDSTGISLKSETLNFAKPGDNVKDYSIESSGARKSRVTAYKTNLILKLISKIRNQKPKIKKAQREPS